MHIQINNSDYSYVNGFYDSDHISTVTFKATLSSIFGSQFNHNVEIKVPFDDYKTNVTMHGMTETLKSALVNKINNGSLPIQIKSLEYIYDDSGSVVSYTIYFITHSDDNSELINISDQLSLLQTDIEEILSTNNIGGIFDEVKNRLITEIQNA